jgi:ribonuclease HII
MKQRNNRPRQMSHLPPPTADPTFFERRLISDGYAVIAGVDEAGRGCLAGPVVAASVILPSDQVIDGLKDSKKLTKKQRDRFFDIICSQAVDWAWSSVDAVEIDRINILNASLRAMREAVGKLANKPHVLLIDGIQGIECSIPQRTIKKGDMASQSIAAASVIAKVVRDRMMVDYKREYPHFSFDIHKGYGTALHLAELRRHGPTPLHRTTFRGVLG